MQADIETLFSIGCHCLPIMTANTVQTTQNALAVASADTPLLVQQARAVLEDIPVQCFKIGLVVSVSTIEVLHTLLRDYPEVPVVLDPVLRAGGGFVFNRDEIIEAMRNLLLPLTTVITPNTEEIRLLAPRSDSLDACANELLDLGCRNVLLTGTHAGTVDVVNRLYMVHQQLVQYSWPRLPHDYHGSGCTLAAAMAAGLAHGLDVPSAAQQAQRFTWESLSHGVRAGFGQHLPDRSGWSSRQD